MFNDPKILAFAFLGGIVPSLLWLWFWYKEDQKKEEPTGILAVIFFLGMLAVVCVFPLQGIIQDSISNDILRIIGWAGVEEILKYLAVLIIVYRTNYVREPVEWPIYLITAALGFAALENALYLIKPLTSGATTVGLLTGQLRFLGSTLLHSITSGVLGISLALTYHLSGFKRLWHIFIGLILAIALHSVFNFFIIQDDGNNFLQVFSFLWVVTIVVMLLFERVRGMN